MKLKMKKSVLLVILSLLLVIAGIIFYIYFSYIFALLQSKMNSFFTMTECIVGSIISGIFIIGLIISIILVSLKYKKK